MHRREILALMLQIVLSFPPQTSTNSPWHAEKSKAVEFH